MGEVILENFEMIEEENKQMQFENTSSNKENKTEGEKGGGDEMNKTEKEQLEDSMQEVEEKIEEHKSDDSNVNEQLLSNLMNTVEQIQERLNNLEQEKEESASSQEKCGLSWLVNSNGEKVGIKFDNKFVKTNSSPINDIAAITVRKSKRHQETTGYYGKVKVQGNIYNYEIFRNNQVRIIDRVKLSHDMYLKLTNILNKHASCAHKKLNE